MNSTSAPYDVVVVGAALVGPILAIALAHRGWRVQLLDTTPTERDPKTDTRPLALSQSSIRILESLGLWQRIRAGATPIRMIHVSEAGRFAKVRLRAEQCGVEAFGYVVNAGDLAGVVHPAAEVSERVQWTRGVEKLAWQPVRDGAAFVGAVAGNGERLFRGSLAVLADSHTRAIEAVPVDVDERPYGQIAIACTLQTSSPNKGVAYERFTDKGPVALLPLGPSRSGLVWSVDAALGESLMVLSDAAFAEQLRAAFGHWLGTLEVISPRVSFPLGLALSRVAENGLPLALVGNSAVRPHPVAGQGLNLALRDVAVLSDLLVDVQPDDGSLNGVNVASQFMRDRRNDRRRTQHLTDSLVKGFGSALGPVRWARASGLLVLSGAPVLQRQFARIAMGLSTPQSRLVRGIKP